MNVTQQMILKNVGLLDELIENAQYLEGWSFRLSRSTPTRFIIRIETENSTEDGRDGPYDHHFQIPRAAMTRHAAERYILNRIMDVHRHEAMEKFKVDGSAPFFPNHDDTPSLYDVKRALPSPNFDVV